MQLVLSNNRVLAHGESFISMGGTVINTETNKVYQNATVAECSGCPSDIDTVGYEYHAGVFKPCAPYGKGNGNIMVACQEDCGTPKDSGCSAYDVIAMPSYLAFVGNVNSAQIEASLGKNNEDAVFCVGRGLAMYARYNDPTVDINKNFPALIECNALKDVNAQAICEIVNNNSLFKLVHGNTYGKEVLQNRAYATFDNELGVGFTTFENTVLSSEILYTPYTFSKDEKLGGLYKFTNTTFGASTIINGQTNSFKLTKNQNTLYFLSTILAKNFMYLYNDTFKIYVIDAETNTELYSFSIDIDAVTDISSTTKHMLSLQNVSSIKICWSLSHPDSDIEYTSNQYVDFSLNYIGLA